MPVFKIVWYDIDDPDRIETETIVSGKDADAASYDLAYDCSGSGVDIEIVSTTEI